MDKGKRSITLRPEGTAPVVRAYVENKLYADAPSAPEAVSTSDPCSAMNAPKPAACASLPSLAWRPSGQRPHAGCGSDWDGPGLLCRVGFKPVTVGIKQRGLPPIAAPPSEGPGCLLGETKDQFQRKIDRLERNPFGFWTENTSPKNYGRGTLHSGLFVPRLSPSTLKHTPLSGYLGISTCQSPPGQGLDYYTQTALKL